jgi:hypothetical protein
MKTKATTETQIVSRMLPVRLVESELRERGDQLASVTQDVTTEQQRQSDMKAQMKARLSELEAKRTQLAITISRREEDREVLVTLRFDYRAGRVTEVRNDTGEELLTRHISDEERQRNLPGLAPEGPRP